MEKENNNEEAQSQVTSIKVSIKLWSYLKSLKIYPRETYEDVIWRFIKDEQQ